MTHAREGYGGDFDPVSEAIEDADRIQCPNGVSHVVRSPAKQRRHAPT